MSFWSFLGLVMTDVQFLSLRRHYPKKMHFLADEIVIESLDLSSQSAVSDLMRRNLSCFNATERPLVATFRRINELWKVYKSKGCRFYVAKVGMASMRPIACVGLGSFQGLPASEGLGEIRDLVVESQYRGRGLGSKLLHLCILDAKKIGYQRLYLESSRHMTSAHRLFLRTGFRPVMDKAGEGLTVSQDPSYFLMESL